MRETDLGSTEKQYMSLTENIAANGPMDERKAMDLARALCSRMLDESGITEADLTAFHPDTILLSPEGTISFSGDTVPESAKEAYLPPEYVKGATSKESIVIYGLGILLLFLVTGQEKKTMMDAGVKNRTLRSIINRCTALDSRRRFQTLLDVRSALNRELTFPRKRMRRLALSAALCLICAACVYMYLSGRTIGEAEGETSGYRNGYRTGYETAVKDAPGIGIEDITVPEAYGNLYGNLNSGEGAYAVMGDGSIYFACGGCVYRMDPYSGETVFLSEHKQLSSLNYWQGRLFYLTEDALVRLDPGTGREETVSDRLGGRYCIYGGTIFLDDDKSTGYLYGIDAVSLETRQLNSESAFEYLNAADGTLLYADPEKGGNLFRCDYDGGSTTRLLSRACRDIDLCGDRVYCLTTGTDDGGAADVLISMDSSGGEVDVLTNQPIRRFIAEENGVFYISDSSGYLEWMTPDGKTRYTISTSPVSDFNLAGRWIFFRMTGDSALYRMRIDGSDREMFPWTGIPR